MADRSVLYRIRAALQGGFVAVAPEIQLLRSYVGVLNGTTDAETALQRIDGTGVGAAIVTFSGSFTAQNSNINDWFGGRQQTRLRCTDDGGVSPVLFTLPGATALNTAFDQLVANGLPEVIRFVIEFTDETSSSFVRIIPRTGTGNPVIAGTSAIIVRSGIAATVEITRSSGTLSNYVFQSIGVIGGEGSGAFDSIKLINPATAVWNANDGGTLPSTGVAKGNAYQVANAPSDGSGRFGEVMQDDDWVVWDGETFTSWSAEPHQWFVLPAHDVRRITALEQDFLTEVEEVPLSNRNTIIRGDDYADSAGEIRLKIYDTVGDYSAADLNTTGDIDVYTDTSNQSGVLAIRLTGTQSTVQDTLPNLYVYIEQAAGDFILLGNMERDFSYQGDFGAESDYVSNFNVNYIANQSIRVYLGTVVDRYTNQNFDVSEDMLTQAVQDKLNNNHGSGTVDEQRLTSLESKMDGLYPLTPEVTKLSEFGQVIGPARTIQEVDITTGYSLIADFRDNATRYESSGVVYAAGTNVVTYSGLGDNLYRTFGFKVTAPADQTLLWIVDGTDRIPFIDMTAAGNFRMNSYREAIGEDQVIRNQVHFLTKTSGPATLAQNDGQVQTFTITNFPANASNTSRTLQFETDVFLNGSDTLAGHSFNIDLPATNTAQDRRTVQATANLGPLYQNRRVPITVGYELRVSGSDLLVDFSIVSVASDITINMTSVATLLNYTAPGATSRVDNFIVFNDLNGDYTFTGENEILITFQPHQANNSMAAVAAAIGTGDAQTLNDIEVPIPAHTFESVEIPDTIDFRTFSPVHFLRHSDLPPLLDRRNVQWCYGLATLLSVRELSITAPIDLAAGSTLNGGALLKAESSVYEATGTGTGSGELVSSVQLPTNYATFNYVHMTEYDTTNMQWKHSEFPTAILSHVDANDSIRLQGNTTVGWTVGTRTLTVGGNAQEIFSVTLKD